MPKLDNLYLFNFHIKGEIEMNAVVNKDFCIGCGQCVNVCPVETITIEA